jgi:UDP-glucose 4-epimerase
VRYLITGGAGFIGSHLADRLVARGDEVIILDDLSTGRRRHLARLRGPVDLVVDDVRSPRTAEAIAAFRPDVVLHLAAMHYIPACVRDPARTLDVNVGGTETVLDALDGVDVTTVVLASSAAVYGFSDEPLSESARTGPIDVYGTSKVRAEAALSSFHRTHSHVRCVAARLFNVFGPNETNPHVVPRIVEQARISDEVRLGLLWPRRDFVFVRDVARALLLAASGVTGYVTFNVGTGVGTSIGGLVRAVGRAARRDIRPALDPDAVRATDGHLVADASKIRSELGWRPEMSLEAGLRELVADVAA